MGTVLEHIPTNVIMQPDRVPRSVSFHLTEVKYGYRPGGSFVLSLIVHSITVCSILFFGRHLLIPSAVEVKPVLTANVSHDVLFLPTVGGGTEGSGWAGGGTGVGKPSEGLRARSRRGFAYPGAQPMISNPPDASLGIQTILQDLPKLPKLGRLVELPNIVEPPHSVVAPKVPALIVKSEKIERHSPADKALEAPTITIHSAPAVLTDVTHLKPQLPIEAAPEAAEISKVHDRQSSLLVLNAVPPPPDVTGKIPHAEERSLFAVTPGDTTIIADPAAGTKAGGTSSETTGNGDVSDIKSGDALASRTSGGSANSRTTGAGTGSGGHYGTGVGTGLNAIVGGGVSGRGTATSSGLGSGSSTGGGSGAGRGSAVGTGNFPGITIQGGRYGNSGNMLEKSDAHHQTSYTLSVVSTAGSGGGLPDFGVFRNEAVYTVYLDMRSSPDDHTTPSWTLQYAVLQPPATAGDARPRIQGTPTPPYANLKQVPQFPPELLHKPAYPLVVASAILSTEGKLEDVSIKQSSEDDLVEPLVEALRNWVFEPAKIAGQPVALKVLLGMRLPVVR